MACLHVAKLDKIKLFDYQKDELRVFQLFQPLSLLFIYQCPKRMHKQGEKTYEKHQNMKQKIEGIKYCRSIKEFLMAFKTSKCTNMHHQSEQFCLQYHSNLDKRRNPYNIHTLLYYPSNICNCNLQKCPKCHNYFQVNFHPLIFKTQKCNNYYDCPIKMQCCFVHSEDEAHFEYGQYFRFDINLFKTKPCLRKDQHERKTCLYFHNDKDMRRPNFESYIHILCKKHGCGCQKSHNKIQQLYHPSRYKSKFCQTYGGDTYSCEYRDFCSFAHMKEEITIDIIDQNNKDPNYIVFTYKTIWCPYTLEHDRANCPYAHNYQDYRRNPKNYKYIAQKCQAWIFNNKIQSIQEGGCKAGLNCNKCHGWMEQRYHPQYYLSAKKSSNINSNKGYDILEKKLKYSNNPSKKDNNIEVIACKEAGSREAQKHTKYTVGAPFFKSERENSQASKKTKAKTGNVCSEKSVNLDEKQPPKKKVVSQHQNKLVTPTSLVYFQDEIWHFNNFNNENNNFETRSRSQGNSSQYIPSYSHTIKDVLGTQGVLMQKLLKEKVSQFKLINSDEKKIQNMSFLNSIEKQKLLKKMREYSLKKDIGFRGYSKGLTTFFVKNTADHILEKLRKKKICEASVLKIHSRQDAKDFSILSEEETELLPKLMKKYKQEIQFGALMTSVQEFVGEPTKENDFNNDK